MLTVNEIFFSIQGEGTRTGLPCVFVRLTGCPLRCVYCDTAYAFHEGQRREEADVLAEVERFPCRLLLLTGGEPLSQPAAFPFATTLLDRGWQVLVETSGHVPIDALDPRAVAIVDVKTPRSGESHRMHWPNLERLRPQDEVKFVIADRADYEWSRTVMRERAAGVAGRRPPLARPRRARPGRAGALGPGGRAARARPGPAPQVPVARRGAGRVTAERPLAVVCVSGGMDSAVTAATAAEGGHDLAFLHANYGQRTEGKELACFHALADHYAARHRLVVDFPGARRHRREQPHRSRHSRSRRRAAGRTGSPPPTCRSATRISSPPRRRGARCSEPARSSSAPSGRTPPGYPDCRPQFYAAFEEAIRQGTRPETSDPHRDAGDRPVQGGHRAGGDRPRSALREDLVLLPGGGRGLRGLRIVPVAAQGFAESGVADPIPYRAPASA